MPQKSDEVEALAKVLWDAKEKFGRDHGHYPTRWDDTANEGYLRNKYMSMARAAIAHLSKPKRGAKRAAK